MDNLRRDIRGNRKLCVLLLWCSPFGLQTPMGTSDLQMSWTFLSANVALCDVSSWEAMLFRSSPCKISISSGVRTASLLPATIAKAKRMIGRIIGIWRDWLTTMTSQRPNPTITTTFWLCPRKVCSCTKAMKFCPWHTTCQWPPWFTWNSPEFNLFQWTFLVHAANNTAGCWWICFNLYSWYYFRAWNMSLWSSRFWLMSRTTWDAWITSGWPHLSWWAAWLRTLGTRWRAFLSATSST